VIFELEQEPIRVISDSLSCLSSTTICCAIRRNFNNTRQSPKSAFQHRVNHKSISSNTKYKGRKWEQPI